MKVTQQVSVLYAVHRWAVHGVLWIAVFLQQHKCKNHISNVLYLCVCAACDFASMCMMDSVDLSYIELHDTGQNSVTQKSKDLATRD